MAKTDRGDRRQRAYLWLCGFVALLGAGLMVYSQTTAFTWDEGFHLLAARLIGLGRKPYIDFCFPQAPFNAYLTAACMRVFGESWRTAHALSSLFSAGAVMLAADYVYSRLPASRWRTAAAFSAALLAGLNGALFEHGSIGQAYGICVFATVAAFRVSIAAVDRRGVGLAALAGFLGGVAASSSLLTAAAAPTLFLWIALRNRAGGRWRKCAAFAVGSAAPFLPVAWLFIQGPRQTWFNLFQYQLLYRAANWPETTRHDFEVLTSWVDSGHALLLGLLAVAGLLVIRAEKHWDRALRAEFHLCGWLAVVLAAEAAVTHPTFPRYFLLTVPFLAIFAAAGVYGIGSRLGGPVRPVWPMLALGALMLLGLGRMLWDLREVYTWGDMRQIARKVQEVTPAKAPLWADEHIYFLSRRAPPAGMEFSYAHTVGDLTPERAARLHILSEAEIKRRVEAGAYSTIETCDDDTEFITSLELSKRYRQRAEISDCAVYWDRIQAQQ